MRFDKPRYFRQSMSWVHTWAGLVMGWLLFAVYVTGALSYFRSEITFWMQPELHATAADDNWLPKAVALLTEKGANAQQWTITPPGPRNPAVGLSYREATPGASEGAGQRAAANGANAGRQAGVPGEMRPAGAGEARQQGQQQGGQPQDRNQGMKRLVMDPASGDVLEPRQTAGGNFLYRFHFELYGMDRIWGRWIVGAATMLMFVAIITGVIVHRNIFKDFFTFRPAKGKRSWLDGHNASGVLSLPFHVLITFSGLLLLATQLMPWAVEAAYQGDRRAYAQEVRGGAAGRDGAAGGQTGTRGGRGEPTELTNLRPLYRQAQQQWPELGVAAIVVSNPGTSRATVEIRQAFGEQLTARGGAERLRFNGVTGEPIETPQAQPLSATRSVWNVFTAVHEGRFATAMVRWMLFLSGVLGALMVASGLALWLVSRQKEREALGRLPRGHRFVEVMNIGAVAGLMVAIGGYFWANRLIPGSVTGRNDQEILCFFVIWGLGFAYAMVRPHKRAWVELLQVGAVLLLLLPVLNALTGGAHLGRSLLNGLWQVAGFDLTSLLAGAGLWYTARQVSHYTPRPAQKKHPVKTAAADANAEKPGLSPESV